MPHDPATAARELADLNARLLANVREARERLERVRDALRAGVRGDA